MRGSVTGRAPNAFPPLRRAAGIIRQSEPEQTVTSPYDVDDSVRRRRKLLGEYLRSLDYESPGDVRRFVKFCGFLLRDLPQDSATFLSISTPLARDGWVWVNGELVRRDISDPEDLARRHPTKLVREHLWRIERDLIDDPAGAVSSAKNLIESVCLGILSDHGKAYERNGGIGPLVKSCYESLGLASQANEYEKSLAKVLGGLNSIAQGVTSLRNAEGTGHGRLEETRLNRVVARLGVNAAVTICAFLVDYAEDQKISHAAAEPQGSLGQCPDCQDEIRQDAIFCESCGLPVVYHTGHRP
jgi:hypothetical protein